MNDLKIPEDPNTQVFKDFSDVIPAVKERFSRCSDFGHLEETQAF
jgi:hypothetical protein